MASHFRDDFFDCPTVRGDALFELADALLCKDGPVTAPVDLTLTAEHRRGHGAMYSALNRGDIDVPRLRQVLAGLPQPQAADGRLVLAVDVTHWLRPDAPTSPDRLFCHLYGRGGRSSDQFVPGRPYSFVAALETGRTSWCQLLDAVRPGPAGRRRRGHRRPGPPDRRGPDRHGPLEDRQPRRPGRLRRRLRRPAHGPSPCRTPGGCARPDAGGPGDTPPRTPPPGIPPRPPHGRRPPKHGGEFRFAKPETWGEPDAATMQVTDRYGTAHAMAWDRIHPRLTTRSAWIGHTAELPVIEGTQIRLQTHRLPGGNDPLPPWLWSSATGLSGDDVDIRWQAFLRRFDLEHTFRMIKQTPDWTRPKPAALRPPTAGPG